MSKRLFAVAAAVAAVLVVAGGLQAGAQTYPPPPASLTVDDPTPAPGQAITVTMSGCQPATFALFGVDVILLGSARVGSDGVAQTTVTIPAALPAGAHTVSGFCIGANHLPLFLRTTITVTPATATPATPTTTPPAAGGSGTGPGSSGSGGRSGTGRAGRSGTAATVPSPDSLAAPAVPADASTLFEDAAEANGVPAGGSSPSAASSGRDSEPAATAASASTADVGPLSTVARVALGLAAIFGVPVALAFSRRPGRATRTTPRPA